MSLRLWLPFNGSIANHGSDGLPMAGTPLSYADGKIGQSLTFNGAVANVIYNNTTNYNFIDNFGFAIWLYPIYTGTTAQYAFTVGRADAGGYGYGIQVISTTQIYVRFGNKSITVDCTSNTWTHIAMAVKGSNIYVYKNGALVSTTAVGSLPTYSDGNGLGVGCFHYSGNIYPYYGRICDFRIYDHAISAKEVKELSKALVLHYPLNDQYAAGAINKFSGDVAAGLVGPGSFTRTKLDNERGYNYKLTRTGTGNSSWPSLGTSAYSFTAGKRYFYSVKVRCNKWTVGSLYLRASRSSNDWVTNSVVICSPSLADGQWHEYYVSQVVNETYDRSGSTVTCNPVLEMYCSDQKAEGTVFDMDFDLKDVQVVESDVYVPFVQNEYASNMKDTSGFLRNGTVSGTLVFNTNTPRYDICTSFENSPYIASPAITCGGFANSYTFAWWGKIKNYTGHMMWGFSNGNRLNLYMSNSGNNFYWNTGDGNGNPFGSIKPSDYINAWHHFAVTGDGSAAKLYIDGVFKANASSYKGITGTQIILNGWDTSASYDFNGSLSDFRVYATALSEADIKELYQAAAHIDNMGGLHCYDITEN